MKEFLSEVLSQIAENLDLTDTQEKTIKKAYERVADWLNEKDSCLSAYDVEIYPQGSMKIGTVVKPLKTDDYDVDMVCVLRKNSNSLSAGRVKRLVGKRLMESPVYSEMLQAEKKRCWTLNYSENLQFHMDILPAIPAGAEEIFATNKEQHEYEFFSTNPHGYARWFRGRMLQQSGVFARESIEPIPDFPRKTPLQKVIQLLKRHRDVMFIDEQDDAPASIIITTLVAQIYARESDLLKLFENVISRIGEIKKKGDEYWVANPVNPDENFAEKWTNNPAKKNNYFKWVQKINEDFEKLMASSTKEELLTILYNMFGQGIVDRVNTDLGGYDVVYNKMASEPREIVSDNVRRALMVPHRQKTTWKLPLWSLVKIEATIKDGTGEYKIFSQEPVGKEKVITFKAIHGVKKPYKVIWQVTNTGLEAMQNNDLRGTFYGGQESDIWTEHTKYRGIHFVQCFIIKQGRCYAKSKEFIVNIQ